MSAPHHNHPEAEERTETKRAPWVPNDDQARQIASIDAWMKANNISNEDLAIFAGIHANTIFHLRRGTYTGNGGNMLRKTVQGVSALTNNRKNVAKLKQARFFETPEFQEFQEALETAKARADVGGVQRLVAASLRSGWGKSEWAKRTAQEVDAVVHAAPSWKHSYRKVLADLLTATGDVVEYNDRRTVPHLESDLIKRLKGTRRTIFIDELSPYNVSPVLLELLRMILNETVAVIAILAVPEFLDRIRDLGGESASQLFRRAVVVTASTVREKHAKMFLEESFAGDPQFTQCAQALAAAATQFGGYHVCREVTEGLEAELSANNTPLSLPVLEAKLNEVVANWQADGKAKPKTS